MPAGHPLDRPVWQALTTRQRAFAVHAERAVRMRASVGPFAAAAAPSPAALDDLAALVPVGAEIVLVEAAMPPLPASLAAVRGLAIDQMVATAPALPSPDPTIVTLGEADAPAMRALAALTVPGPFGEETHRLGRFVGIVEGGLLVAMAGERLRVDGFTEASAICTHPDARGRGHARRLLGEIMRGIIARGETPFLHCYATNQAAIALYESLGFRRRATFQAITLARR